MATRIKLNRPNDHILKITKAHHVLNPRVVLTDVSGCAPPMTPERLAAMEVADYGWLDNDEGEPLGLLMTLVAQPGKRLVITVNREGLYEASLFKQRGPAWVPLGFNSSVAPADLPGVVAALVRAHKEYGRLRVVR